MPKRPTVYDVAREAHVSTATVSRVFNNPGSVRPETRVAVNEAVRKLSYVPSGSAKGLASQKTGTIGLLIPNLAEVKNLPHLSPSLTIGVHQQSQLRLDPQNSIPSHSDDPYYNLVLRGCELEAWNAGFSLMISIVMDSDNTDEVLSSATHIASKTDGIVILSTTMQRNVIQSLSKITPVTVIAGATSAHSSICDSVISDNYAGMKLLTEHMLHQHHITNFAYLAGPDDSPDNHVRYSAFCDAVSQAGIIPESVPIYRCGFNRVPAAQVVHTLIRNNTLPRALICANDQMALGALDALQESHIRVPEDVFVTGFDGINETELSRPRLTTIHQPMLDLGRTAIRSVVRRIENPEAQPETTVLATTVLLRESCEGKLES